jgi:hypothetical protein
LHEIAGFGSILRRFDQSFERFRTRGTACGDYHHGGQSNCPISSKCSNLGCRRLGLLCNDGQPDHEFREIPPREHCSLITLSGTSKQNDKT